MTTTLVTTLIRCIKHGNPEAHARYLEDTFQLEFTHPGNSHGTLSLAIDLPPLMEPFSITSVALPGDRGSEVAGRSGKWE